MSQQIYDIADHFFRHEAGNLRAALTRVLGMAYLDVCEDVIQEAMYRALTKWSVGGIPPNPSGWIFRTAHNVAIDLIRRDKLFTDKAEQITAHLRRYYETEPSEALEEEIADNLLRMVFTCCHPELSEESRLVLTLKVVCSFHNKEIASALLKKRDAVERMVSRGKQKLQQLIDLENPPAGSDLQRRLTDVLRVVYLLFNEGYKASSGPQLIKEQLCLEAIRLARLLSEHPATALPATHALTALLLFHAARFPGRVNAEGQLLLLQAQDRREWDRDVIRDAQGYLNRASMGEQLSEYHLLAGIAACHAFAPDYGSTDWNLILDLYDQLVAGHRSPVVLLNRVVAVLQARGPAAAEQALGELAELPRMQSYYLYHMVCAEVALAAGAPEAAVAGLRTAQGLTRNEVEKTYIERRISDIKG